MVNGAYQSQDNNMESSIEAITNCFVESLKHNHLQNYRYVVPISTI